MQYPLHIRKLGLTDYETTWRAMQRFTVERTKNTADELWLTQHDAVYTLGLNRKGVRLPADSSIPLVLADRGGKITYHGPGQIVIYLLIDLKRRGMSIRQLVTAMESAIVILLAGYGIQAAARADAPGVYVHHEKIAALGLRLKNGCCYHGLSLNVDMDLAPFAGIDPCGYKDLKVTQTRDLGIKDNIDKLATRLLALLEKQLHESPHGT